MNFLEQGFLASPERFESRQTERIYRETTICRDQSQPVEKRGAAWKRALEAVVIKGVVTEPLSQAVRPAHYKEPLIDRSPIDDRILEGYPPLQQAVHQGRLNPQAAFGIIAFFQRNHNKLNDHQLSVLANNFPNPHPNQRFTDYKNQLEAATAALDIPGKTPQESWVIKRHVIDLLELADLIKTKHLTFLSAGKTIYVSDLMKIVANALNTVHQASSRLGVARLKFHDHNMLKNKDNPTFRDQSPEIYKIMFRDPRKLLQLIFSDQKRSFQEDFSRPERMAQNLQVIGRENIPSQGKVIVAFSHIERWKDPKADPNWTKLSLIGHLQNMRKGQPINLVAYLAAFYETAPPMLRGALSKIVHTAVKVVKDKYNINVIDVNTNDLEKARILMENSVSALNQGQVLIISPEGLPAPETVKPRRGLGLIARMSGAPVVGVAFREDRLPNGQFEHKMIFTQPIYYNLAMTPGKGSKEKDQFFSDFVMRNIAAQLPTEQQGIFRD